MQIIWNGDEYILPWACEIMNTPMEFFDKPRCAGVISNNGTALAAAVFSSYYPMPGTMQLSFASSSPRWATRQIIKSILYYPFEVCHVQKLWTLTPHTNERALKLNRGLGFKQEGLLARHLGIDKHAIVSRMFREDYERLWKEGKDGRRRKGRQSSAPPRSIQDSSGARAGQ